MATSQQSADNLLQLWQFQRDLGIKPEQRKLDTTEQSDSAFERDLAVIRQCMERSR